MNTAPVKRTRNRAGNGRLEARVSSELKRLFQRAADLQGVTLSDFVIASVRQAALATLEQHELIRLSERDAALFAEAMMNAPGPNPRLEAAARRYCERKAGT